MDRSVVERVAHLARLKLGEKELNELTDQLNNVLKHFEQISRIDTQGVEPLVTPTEMKAHWREDEVIQETTAEEVVANAPSKQGHLFSVPPVVG